MGQAVNTERSFKAIQGLDSEYRDSHQELYKGMLMACQTL